MMAKRQPSYYGEPVSDYGRLRKYLENRGITFSSRETDLVDLVIYLWETEVDNAYDRGYKNCLDDGRECSC